jgi:hypothetical protein
MAFGFFVVEQLGGATCPNGDATRNPDAWTLTLPVPLLGGRGRSTLHIIV